MLKACSLRMIYPHSDTTQQENKKAAPEGTALKKYLESTYDVLGSEQVHQAQEELLMMAQESRLLRRLR